MHVAVIALPSQLPADSVSGRTVVVIDVLRATTTIACALESGAAEVRIFPGLSSAVTAHGDFVGPKLLAGERDCHRPPGFDLGNSPLEMTPRAVGGRTLFMSTTNGTRAIAAALEHPTLLGGTGGRTGCYAGALVNAQATARQLGNDGRDALLLCAGSDGEPAEEDLIGAGAILAALEQNQVPLTCAKDAGAREWFERFQRDPVRVLRETR